MWKATCKVLPKKKKYKESPLLQSAPFKHQEASIIMGNSFRRQPLGTLYPESKTPVTEDLLQVGLLFAFGIIALSFIVIIPGIRGLEVSSIRVLITISAIAVQLLELCNISAENLGNTSCVYSTLDWCSATCLQFHFLVWR